ncbi:MAG TPA: hypothetical protein VFW67_06375 [Burkholderiaceae bacterium]|nr:hypothetical protein [Burkholderiaceae bacterium]
MSLLPLTALAACGGSDFTDMENQPADAGIGRIYRDSFEKNSVSIVNDGNESIDFQLKINGNCFFGDTESVVSAVRELEGFSIRDFTFNSWRWMIDQTYHHDPYTGSPWKHDPALFINSFGWGYCDDVASVMAEINTQAGIGSRVWGLEGHVVSEHWINGKWRIYDVDLKAVYLNNFAEVLGVDEISRNFSFEIFVRAINSPQAADFYRIMTSDGLLTDYVSQQGYAPWAYGRTVESIYTSLDNNAVLDERSWHLATRPILTDKITLPAGALIHLNSRVELNLVSMYDTKVPRYFVMEVVVKPNTEGRVSFPLHPVEIKGGAIFLDPVDGGAPIRLTADEATAQLSTRTHTMHNFYAIAGNEYMYIKFLLNPTRFNLNNLQTLEVLAEDLTNLKVQS